MYEKSLVSDKGKNIFEEIKKHWKIAWEDESIRTKLAEEWKKFAAKNTMCQGYERTEGTEEEETAEGKGEGDLA